MNISVPLIQSDSWSWWSGSQPVVVNTNPAYITNYPIISDVWFFFIPSLRNVTTTTGSGWAFARTKTISDNIIHGTLWATSWNSKNRKAIQEYQKTGMIPTLADVWPSLNFWVRVATSWAYAWWVMTYDSESRYVSEETLVAWANVWASVKYWLAYYVTSLTPSWSNSLAVWATVEVEVALMDTTWALTVICTDTYTTTSVITSWFPPDYSYRELTNTPVVAAAWDKIAVTVKITWVFTIAANGWPTWWGEVYVWLGTAWSLKQPSEVEWYRPIFISLS